MTQPERLSLGVAARLARYLQVLTQAKKEGKETISSQELSEWTHVNSTQIRRDLSGFGKFGKRGVGYNVDSLVSQIRKILRTAGQHNIALFGAGHVGKAIVQVLSALPCRIRWFDPRPDAFPDHVPPGVEVEVTNAPERDVATLPDGAWLLIMTHSHALDLGIAAKALQENRFAYIGLIGSTTKRARFEKRFRELGIPEDQIAKLTCPIGIGGISGKHPGEIAIATAAQLLQLREQQKQVLRVIDESAA